jgi:hypothetical protein
VNRRRQAATARDASAKRGPEDLNRYWIALLVEQMPKLGAERSLCRLGFSPNASTAAYTDCSGQAGKTERRGQLSALEASSGWFTTSPASRESQRVASRSHSDRNRHWHRPCHRRGSNRVPDFQELNNSNSRQVGGEVGVDANGNGHPADGSEGRQPPLLAAVSPDQPPEPPTADQLAQIERLRRERGIEEAIPTETTQDAAGVIAALESAKSSTAIQRVRAMARALAT